MHLNLYEDALKAAEEAIDKDSSNIRAYAAASAALTSLGRRKKQAQAWDKIKNALMEQAQEEEF